MSILDEFLKGAINKSNIATTKDIVSSMHLIDFGVITEQYADGTCDVTCMKEVNSGGLRKYHGVEILYPCGIKNIQVNQMCILVNPLSSVYKTTDIENPDFIESHDQRCIKAIPVSNSITSIFAGIDVAGNFSVSNKGTCILLDKWSTYFGTCDRKAGVSILSDGTIDISMNKGKMQMLIHPTDGLAFIHYGSDKKALEALVMKPNGEKINLFFCSELFTFTKVSDILDIGENKWKRIEKTDTDGILHIYTGTASSGPDRHLATSEDLKLLWDAFKNHTHYYTWTDGSGNNNTNAPVTTLTNPHDVSGIIVKDGDLRNA